MYQKPSKARTATTESLSNKNMVAQSPDKWMKMADWLTDWKTDSLNWLDWQTDGLNKSEWNLNKGIHSYSSLQQSKS